MFLAPLATSWLRPQPTFCDFTQPASPPLPQRLLSFLDFSTIRKPDLTCLASLRAKNGPAVQGILRRHLGEDGSLRVTFVTPGESLVAEEAHGHLSLAEVGTEEFLQKLTSQITEMVSAKISQGEVGHGGMGCGGLGSGGSVGKEEKNGEKAGGFYVTVSRVGVFELIQAVWMDPGLDVLAQGS